jgi:hypothetical protein
MSIVVKDDYQLTAANLDAAYVIEHTFGQLLSPSESPAPDSTRAFFDTRKEVSSFVPGDLVCSCARLLFSDSLP